MLTDEKIAAIAKPYIQWIGSHWENEEAISERYIEYFARDIERAVLEEPAARPWEPYSEEAYEKLRDSDGRVWALFLPENDYCCVVRKSYGWLVCKTCTCYMPGRNPTRIARINPPKESEK